MAQLKMKKMPKKPKAKASVKQMENYLKKVAEIKKENSRRTTVNKKADNLRKKISGLK